MLMNHQSPLDIQAKSKIFDGSPPPGFSTSHDPAKTSTPAIAADVLPPMSDAELSLLYAPARPQAVTSPSLSFKHPPARPHDTPIPSIPPPLLLTTPPDTPIPSDNVIPVQDTLTRFKYWVQPSLPPTPPTHPPCPKWIGLNTAIHFATLRERLKYIEDSGGVVVPVEQLSEEQRGDLGLRKVEYWVWDVGASGRAMWSANGECLAVPPSEENSP
jgi:hypothetical protein